MRQAKLLTIIDLIEEEIKILVAILQFSITACPLDSVSQDVEIDSEKLERLISKLQKESEP